MISNHEKTQNTGVLPERLERLTNFMRRYVDSGKVAGFVGLVARHGEIVYLEKYGYQVLETQIPMGVDSIFRIFSMTKPITSVALMMLFEDGKVRLSDPVATFIPGFKNIEILNWQGQLEPINTEITVHMLLTHTAGLCYGEWDSLPVAEYYKGQNLLDPTQTLGQFVHRLIELPQAFQPGTKWHYGFSTDVVGRLVEIISGMPLKDYLQQNIFLPLGIHDTTYLPSIEQKARVSRLYGPVGDSLLTPLDFMFPTNDDDRLHCGGHGLYSTVQDYYQFAQMILNRGELNGVRLLAPRTVEFMCLNHLHEGLLPIEIGGNPMRGIGFGLGFSSVTAPALAQTLRSMGTSGWGGAASTDFWVDFQSDLIGILMTQVMPRERYSLDTDFHSAVYQMLIL